MHCSWRINDTVALKKKNLQKFAELSGILVEIHTITKVTGSKQTTSHKLMGGKSKKLAD
jgi:hypothetical protein